MYRLVVSVMVTSLWGESMSQTVKTDEHGWPVLIWKGELFNKKDKDLMGDFWVRRTKLGETSQ